MTYDENNIFANHLNRSRRLVLVVWVALGFASAALTPGSSIAVGHPWTATGGRIGTTLATELARRDARYGLVSICAAGAMAGAFLLERS